MIKTTKVGDMVFLEQTTFYAYENEEAQKEGRHFACTSSLETFQRWIANAEVNPGTVPTPLGLLKPNKKK